MIYRYSIIVFCLLCLFSCDKRANIRDGIPQAHDSISNRKKDTFSDSIPLEQTLIPPKQIDDLHNFQVVYCDDNIFRMFPTFFDEKTYEPLGIITYRNSLMDSVLVFDCVSFFDYTADAKSGKIDEIGFNNKWNIEKTKNVQIHDRKLIDNGRPLNIEAINYNEYYCYDSNKLVIYKFVNQIVLPLCPKEGDTLHLPYIFEDTKHFMNDNTK